MCTVCNTAKQNKCFILHCLLVEYYFLLQLGHVQNDTHMSIENKI